MSKDKLSIARCPHMFGKYFDLHQFLHLHIFLPKFGSSQTSALPHTILPHGMSVTGGIYGIHFKSIHVSTNSFTLVFRWMLGRFRLQVVKLNIIYPANQAGNSRFWAWIRPQQSKRIDVRKMLKQWLGPCGRDVSSQSSEGLWLLWLRKSFD